jgi:hypothetical protein
MHSQINKRTRWIPSSWRVCIASGRRVLSGGDHATGSFWGLRHAIGHYRDVISVVVGRGQLEEVVFELFACRRRFVQSTQKHLQGFQVQRAIGKTVMRHENFVRKEPFDVNISHKHCQRRRLVASYEFADFPPLFRIRNLACYFRHSKIQLTARKPPHASTWRLSECKSTKQEPIAGIAIGFSPVCAWNRNNPFHQLFANA